MPDKTGELEQKADRLANAIATLSSQIQQIESKGEVASAGCCVLRYQARGKRGTYWYYKLHALLSDFPNSLRKDERIQTSGKSWKCCSY
jgi:hypothetical protein